MTFSLPILLEQRLVLFPQGQPASSVHRDRCTELVLWSGGDVGRVIDAPTTSIEVFSTYLQRIRGLQDGSESAIVVLTRTNPLALTVVDLRRKLEARIPSLRTARWVIYLDMEQDPFFTTMAPRLGHLTGDVGEAPVWLGPLDTPYLVLASTLADRNLVCEGLRELDEAVLSTSGERRVLLAKRRPPI